MSTPTTGDAEVIIKLYDLRREAEMRKARNWWTTQFWPRSTDEVMKIMNNFGSQENNWVRQVTGYWEMAASMALRGAVSKELFLEPGFSSEMFFIFAKLRPFLSEIREKLQSPRFFSNAENLITSSAEARDFLAIMEGRVAARIKAMAETASAKAS